MVLILVEWTKKKKEAISNSLDRYYIELSKLQGNVGSKDFDSKKALSALGESKFVGEDGTETINILRKVVEEREKVRDRDQKNALTKDAAVLRQNMTADSDMIQK